MQRLVYVSIYLFIYGNTCLAQGQTTNDAIDDSRTHELDQLSAIWSFYKFHYIRNGQVISLDEGEVTTSEGQSYGMLRSVFSSDRDSFDEIWTWTKLNLQKRGDALFAWKFKDKILDHHSASDADCDMAFALILASRAFANKVYLEEAKRIIDDIWRLEVVKTTDGNVYLAAGDWSKKESHPKIHLGYFAPASYELFATVDDEHDWDQLIKSGYALLDWGFSKEKWVWPPSWLYIKSKNGGFIYTQSQNKPNKSAAEPFSYDVFPLFWRLALDYRWNLRSQSHIRQALLKPGKEAFHHQGVLYDRYQVTGKSLSKDEVAVLYGTMHALALVEDEGFAAELYKNKLLGIEARYQDTKATPYYLQNWFWFGKAFAADIIKAHDEFLGFLRPFNFRLFEKYFPTYGLLLLLILLIAQIWLPQARDGALILCFLLCIRYLVWRLTTFNTAEPLAYSVSLLLYGAEIYSFGSVLLLFVQKGWTKASAKDLLQHQMQQEMNPAPDLEVAVMIPIYSEPLSILENTLIGCRALSYSKKTIYVLDDGHRQEVENLAKKNNVVYIKGPKKHAKAGNLNHALTLTTEPLIVVFDTDHIPMTNFIDETIPYFNDQEVAFVQTPHVFYNLDIFQRAFRAESLIPHEGDMFNHAIQSLKNTWGGAIFAGSGAMFRRAALESIGGFKLESITEDIHTSQHLHAKGWKSVFVDKNLAVGLEAENFSSFLTQRKRWMQGCLQILFKDSSLKMPTLPRRHKLGYFASHYYFLYPIPRVIYWFVPLLFLLFHHYPLLADVSVLAAYTVPFFLVLSIANHLLIPDWPRIFWNGLYETSITFPLIAGMIEQLLPKRLGFKVTPKGITSERRIFDFNSSRLNLLVWGVSLVAILKGFFEMNFFGIEKDAYFFNLAWAMGNFSFLTLSLLLAWEKPQRRTHERIHGHWPIQLSADGGDMVGVAANMSLGGACVIVSKPPHSAQDTPFQHKNGLVKLSYNKQDIHLPWNLIHVRNHKKHWRLHLKFDEISQQAREFLITMMFTDPHLWQNHHHLRTKSYAITTWAMLRGAVFALLPQTAPQGGTSIKTKSTKHV